ncbi:MAG TPA: DUF5818 domain-containing protein [Candidatus Sulfotelmatobacter sp.]|jgi:hypothetical protein|nr:DUF5818 domain-containing protein [Candidatus Sulfotelmatobacter sp.]
MKRFLSIVALLSLSGLGMSLSAAAQQSSTPSTSDQAGSAASAPQQQQTDATNPQQSARSFEGKITKSGDQLVLQDSATQASYKLDDQDKAKQYEGQSVKVMATMDPSSNTLHVVDISPSESK